MNISPVTTNAMAFKGNENIVKKTGGGGKAIASALIPGLGQFCDGRNKQGAKFLGGAIGLGMINRLFNNQFAKNILKTIQEGLEKAPKGTTAWMVAAGIAGLATTALWITNIVDAYKGGKNKSEVKEA